MMEEAGGLFLNYLCDRGSIKHEAWFFQFSAQSKKYYNETSHDIKWKMECCRFQSSMCSLKNENNPMIFKVNRIKNACSCIS